MLLAVGTEQLTIRSTWKTVTEDARRTELTIRIRLPYSVYSFTRNDPRMNGCTRQKYV